MAAQVRRVCIAASKSVKGLTLDDRSKKSYEYLKNILLQFKI